MCSTQKRCHISRNDDLLNQLQGSERCTDKSTFKQTINSIEVSQRSYTKEEVQDSMWLYLLVQQLRLWYPWDLESRKSLLDVDFEPFTNTNFFYFHNGPNEFTLYIYQVGSITYQSNEWMEQTEFAIHHQVTSLLWRHTNEYIVMCSGIKSRWSLKQHFVIKPVRIRYNVRREFEIT